MKLIFSSAIGCFKGAILLPDVDKSRTAISER